MPPKRKAQSTELPSAKKAKRDDTTADAPDFGDLDAASVAKMSYDDLRSALKSIGESPGPINDSTRPMYEKMLIKRHQQKKKEHAEKATAASSFSSPNTSMFQSPPAPLGTSSRFETFSAPPQEQPWQKASPGPSVGGGSRPLNVASKKPTVKRGGKAAVTALSRTPPPPSLRGIVPAAYTPLTPSGDLNLPVIDVYADYLVDNGVAGVFVNGTTGEGLKLSVGERKQVLECWIHALDGRLPVLAHVGAESLKDSQELATHARAFGVSAVAVMAPCTFKPQSAEHMLQYMMAVAAVIPNVPFYYYHIPSLTGTTFCIEELLDQAVKRISSFAGVKYSDPDLSKFLACKAHSFGKLHMMYGKDEQMLAALAMGAESFVGSTYNLCPQVYHNLMKAFANGQLSIAQQEQLRSQRMCKCLIAHGGIVPAGRALLTLCGVDVGPPRLPDRELSSHEVAEMKRDLQALGFFSWV